jgi:hypothetical protein
MKKKTRRQIVPVEVKDEQEPVAPVDADQPLGNAAVEEEEEIIDPTEEIATEENDPVH